MVRVRVRVGVRVRVRVGVRVTCMQLCIIYFYYNSKYHGTCITRTLKIECYRLWFHVLSSVVFNYYALII